MSTTIFRIILQGLIALAPDNSPASLTDPKMTALLVATQATAAPPQGAQCYSKHHPMIDFSTTDRECTDAHPKCRITSEGRCLCNLDRDEVSLELRRVQSRPVPLDEKPRRALPFDNKSAGDFAYVANLGGYRLKPGILPAGSQTPPPPALAARFNFPFDTASACDFVTRRDESADYAHSLSLRPLGRSEGAEESRQGMAQMVETTVQVDRGTPVKLVISSFAGEQPVRRHEFTLLTDLAEEEIEILNHREDEVGIDEPCDDGIGRDFASFYDLVEQTFPTWAERPVPHLKYSERKSIADLYPLSERLLCRRTKAPQSHPICPMATFNPPSSSL